MQSEHFLYVYDIFSSRKKDQKIFLRFQVTVISDKNSYHNPITGVIVSKRPVARILAILGMSIL